MTSKAFLFRLVLSGHAGFSHRPVPSPQWSSPSSSSTNRHPLYSRVRQHSLSGQAGKKPSGWLTGTLTSAAGLNVCLLHETHLNSDPSPTLCHGTDSPTEAGGTPILVFWGIHQYSVMFSDLRHLEATVI